MTEYIHIPPPLNALAIEGILKHDEQIVCRNATVIVDNRGQISWIDNDKPLCIAAKEDKNERRHI